MESLCISKMVSQKSSMKPKLVRVTTVPVSMNILLKNQLKFMSDYFDVIGITSYDSKHFHEVEEREGARMYQVDLSRAISPFKDIKTILQLVSIFRKEKPEIVHSHTPKAGLLAMFAAKISGVPIRLHTLAGMPLMEAKGLKKYLFILSEKVTYICANKVYPNSKGLYDYVLLNKLGGIDRFKVIGSGSSNGIDLSYFSKNQFDDFSAIKKKVRNENGVDDKDFVFCFVGRIAGDKGINELISSFTFLSDKYNTQKTEKRIHLILIGVYDKSDMPSETTKQLINSNVSIKFLGRFDDIRPYLIASDALVFPSYREGFPNVVLQAGAMELPSIVTDINGCNELITEGINGLIIPVKNTERLTEAMETMINNDIKRLEMGKIARLIIVDKFEQTKLHQAILDEYKTLLYNKHCK